MRFLLALTTLCGGFFAIVTLAVQGSQWATAVCVAVVGLVLSMSIQAVTFGAAWILASFFGVFRRGQSASSPFADAKPPPQYIEPLTLEE